MQEICPCLACYVMLWSKAEICCSEIEAKIKTSSVKENDKDAISLILLKNDNYDLFLNFRSATLLKNRLEHRCFPEDFAIFLEHLFL